MPSPCAKKEKKSTRQDARPSESEKTNKLWPIQTTASHSAPKEMSRPALKDMEDLKRVSLSERIQSKKGAYCTVPIK